MFKQIISFVRSPENFFILSFWHDLFRGGLTCALCYCGEKSLLGQGDLTRYDPTVGFNPFKKPPLRARGSREFIYASSPVSSGGSSEGFEKVTKTAAVQRRGAKSRYCAVAF